jgi:uncharacterized membrane protein
MIKWFSKNKWVSDEENRSILEAISLAEMQTSGEIRVYIESRNPLVSTLERAHVIFQEMGMHATAQRNGVLIYLAVKDKEVAIIGDEGIHQKVGTTFWETRIQEMILCFKNNQLSNGLINCIGLVGQVLSEQFPYLEGQDKNELPNDIHFGK